MTNDYWTITQRDEHTWDVWLNGKIYASAPSFETAYALTYVH